MLSGSAPPLGRSFTCLCSMLRLIRLDFGLEGSGWKLCVSGCGDCGFKGGLGFWHASMSALQVVYSADWVFSLW